MRGGVNLSRLGRRRSRKAAGDGEKTGSGRERLAQQEKFKHRKLLKSRSSRTQEAEMARSGLVGHLLQNGSVGMERDARRPHPPNLSSIQPQELPQQPKHQNTGLNSRAHLKKVRSRVAGRPTGIPSVGIKRKVRGTCPPNLTPNQWLELRE